MARVLALSSHVAFGSVGLAAIVPALHWLGHEVIALPTVVLLSNHPGYPRFAGDPVLPGADRRHGRSAGSQRLAGRYCRGDHRLSAEPAHVAEARSAVERVRRANPERSLPVRSSVRRRGRRALSVRSHGRPPSATSCCRSPAWRLPTGFELSWLAGLPVGDAAEARQAAWALGVPSVLATSVPASDNRLANVLVSGDESIACCVSRRPSAPHGTGDLLAAMYLGPSPQRRGAGHSPRRRRVGRRCQRRRQPWPG